MSTTMHPNASTPTEENPMWYGSIAHTEFGSTDPQATMEFLGNVFGMKFQSNPGPGPMEYHMAYTPGQPSCAVRPAMPQENGPSQTPYIVVPDLGVTLEAVADNGGTIVLPRTEMPGGAFAWFQMPGGPFVAIMQMEGA